MSTSSALRACPEDGILSSMLLRVAWIFFGTELALAVFFGLVFWYFWSHSALSRDVAVRALLIYAFGCLLTIVFALSVPL